MNPRRALFSFVPLALMACLSVGVLPGGAAASEFLPGDGNLKIRAGDDTRSPVLFLIDKGLIYEGDRKGEDAIRFNFRGDLVREGRERTGDHLLRIRDNRIVDPDNNTVFTVSNGKIFGPDDRRTVLFTVGGSKVYAGDDRKAEPLYTCSGSKWNTQQTALIVAVMIELELLPVETVVRPTAAESAADAPSPATPGEAG